MVQVGNAAFDGGVETAEAAFSVADFGAQRRQACGVILVFRHLPLHQPIS
jgi:hypothetical protein